MLGINNENCFDTIRKMREKNRKVGLILTSPPNNTSKNKLTRICEFVYVFVRKSELKSFNTNKKVKSVSARGQNYYENVFNLIEARNNDGSNNLNKATFSSELVLKLLDIYYTGVACEMLGIKWLGSEISTAQCNYARNRIEEVKNGSSSN